MKRINTAVIGAGRIGKLHINNLIRHVPAARVKAVADHSVDHQWVKKLGIPTATNDVDAVLSDPSIDAVVIATSTTSHVELIKAASKAGKQIYCEKPIAFTPELIADAVKATEKAGVLLQVGFNRRFDPHFHALKEKLDEGIIGQPHILKITNRDPKRPDHNFVPRSGGLFIDFNVHDFDMARYLTNSEIIEVYAAGDVLVDPELVNLNDIDTAVISCRMANGALCVIDSSRETNYGHDQRVEVFGSKGSVQATNLTATRATLTTAEGVTSEAPLYSFVERYHQAFINQFKTFFNCIQEQKPSTVSGHDALKAIEASVAANKSLKERRSIEVSVRS